MAWITDKRLAWKISIAILIIISLMGMTIYLAIDINLSRTIYAEHNEKGIAVGKNLAMTLVEPILLDNHSRIQLLLIDITTSESKHKRDIVYSFLIGVDNNVLAHTFVGGFPYDLRNLNKPGANETYSLQRIDTEKGQILDIAVPVLQGQAGYLHLGLSRKNINQKINNTRLNIIAICLLVSILAVTVSFALSNRIIRLLAELARGAYNIGKGNLAYRVKIERSDEIGIVAKAFNHMAESLQEDIKQRVQTEKALQESETLYRSLVENIDLGVTLIDKHHNIVMANSAQGRLFKKPVDTFIGKKCFREFEKRTEACRHCPGLLAMSAGKPAEIVTEGIRDGGCRFVVRIRAFPILDKEGDSSGFVEVVEDVTVKQKMEEELLRVRQIESIGLLAGGIAHDFNNLLVGVYGNIELAKMIIAKDHKAQGTLDDALNASKRTRQLTNQLLTFSKGGAPIKTTYPIAKVIKETSEFLLKSSNINCILNIPKELYSTEIDKNQIDQVFYNILLNAKEAMPQVGKITIQLRNYSLDKTDSRPLSPGNYIKVSISDEGHGIDNEIIEQIFDPYFSTKEMGKEKGQGLGLAICHSIIIKHHGYITVESMKGKGTTFNIFLPAKQKYAKNKHLENQELQAADLCKKRILVMDDEDVVTQVVEGMLGYLGYTCKIVKNGDEAISLFKKAREDSAPFDLVILDLSIRGGMGGEETNRNLHEIDPEVITVVASGYTDNPVMSNHNEYGFKAAIEKPFTLKVLEETLKQFV